MKLARFFASYNRLLFLLLFLFSFFISQAQQMPPPVKQVESIAALSEDSWIETMRKKGYLEGTYLEKISGPKSRLLSMVGYMEKEGDMAKPWMIDYFAAAGIEPMLVIEEKFPEELIRIESNQLQNSTNNWETFGPVKLDKLGIDISEITILVQIRSEDGTPFFIPAFIYQSEKPQKINVYRITFYAGQDYSGGSYKVFFEDEVVHEGFVGNQLGGSRFDLRIPVSKLKKSGVYFLLISLKEVGLLQPDGSRSFQMKDYGPELRMHFYHHPLP